MIAYNTCLFTGTTCISFPIFLIKIHFFTTPID